MNRLVRRACRNLLLTNVKSKYQSVNIVLRMSASSYLINDPNYSFLKELGLNVKNSGVFAKHCDWRGNGQSIDSVCPANNRPIATVVQGSVQDYEHCIEESVNAWKLWADVFYTTFSPLSFP